MLLRVAGVGEQGFEDMTNVRTVCRTMVERGFLHSCTNIEALDKKLEVSASRRTKTLAPCTAHENSGLFGAKGG